MTSLVLVYLRPPFWRNGGCLGQQWYRLPFERDGCFLSALHCDVTYCTISNHSAAIAVECLRRSNQQGVGHFRSKFGEEGVDGCKPNFNVIWERHRAVVSNRNRVDIFCRLSTMHERDRQTDHGTVTDITSITIRKHTW